MKIYTTRSKDLVFKATPNERLHLMENIRETHEYFRKYADDRIRGMVKVRMEVAWKQIPFGPTLFGELIGRPRVVFPRHGLRASDKQSWGRHRLRGRFDPNDIKDITTVLEAMQRKSRVPRAVLDRLFDPMSHTDPHLMMLLLGSTRYRLKVHYRDNPEEYINAYDLLGDESRSSNKGRPVPSEAAVQDHREDPADQRRGRSKKSSKAPDPGPVSEPQRDPDPHPAPDQDEIQQPDDADQSAHSLFRPEEPGPADNAPAYGDIDEVDLTGDAYLADLQLPEGSDILADFEEWEQGV